MADDATRGSSPNIQIDFITDVEGNLEYFNRWVRRSRVVTYNEDGELDLAHNHAYFVYGGDVMDRCPGGRRLCRRLVALKRRAPDRVFLLAGNRDLNKLRLTAELGDTDSALPASAIPGPHWDPKAPSLHSYLEQLAAERETTVGALDCRAERLRYLFKHTLGCPTTFEDRRKELCTLEEEDGCSSSSSDETDENDDGKGGSSSTHAAAAAAVSDERVVESFLEDIAPGGALRDYLEHACLVAILGNTVFVHGALDANNMGLVPDDATRFCNPPTPPPMKSCETLAQWAAEMNGVLRRGLAAHLARPDWDSPERTTRGGEVLMALQNRCAMWGRCLVSGAYVTGGCITNGDGGQRKREDVAKRMASGGDALAFEGWVSDPRDGRVAEWLLQAGVRRIVVGHKPSGDSPAVLSHVYTGVEVVSADTSYADTSSADGRGVSVAGVTLEGASLECNRAKIWGTLSDGRQHEVCLATLSSAGGHDGGDPYVGRELDDGWWVKTLIATTPPRPASPSSGGGGEASVKHAPDCLYLLCRGEGRRVEYRDEVLAST